MADTSGNRDSVNKWLTTIGCFLLLVPFGQTFYWGNMYIYCKSYLQHYTGMSLTDQAPWLLTVKVGSTGITSLLSGYLIRHVSKRLLLACGVILTSLSYFSTYFTIQLSNSLVVLSFGALYGMADGFIFIVGIQVMVDWAGSKDGTYIGIVRSGMYVGAIFTNSFVTWYVNPKNEVPNQRSGPVVYFSQPDILDKVPGTFLILGTICTVLQTLGFVLVRIKQQPKEMGENPTPSETYGACDGGASSVEYSKHRRDGGGGGEEEKMGVPKPHGLSRGQSKPSSSPSSLSSSSSSSSSTTSSSSSSSSATSSKHFKTKQESEDTHYDVKPQQMILTPSFYALAFTFITSSVTYIAVNTFYKDFGQLWVADDFLLTRIGTFVPIVTIFFSIFWGILLDRFGVKNFLILFNVCLALLGCFYSYTPRLNVWTFSIGTVVYGAMVCPLYSVYNGATAKLFGKPHFGTNQGILYIPSIIISLSMPPVFQAIILQFGWDYLFLFPAFINLIGMVILVVTPFANR